MVDEPGELQHRPCRRLWPRHVRTQLLQANVRPVLQCIMEAGTARVPAVFPEFGEQCLRFLLTIGRYMDSALEWIPNMDIRKWTPQMASVVLDFPAVADTVVWSCAFHPGMHVAVQLAFLMDRRGSRRGWHAVLCIHSCRPGEHQRRRSVSSADSPLSRLACTSASIQDLSEVLDEVVLAVWAPVRCIGRRWWLAAMVSADNHTPARPGSTFPHGPCAKAWLLDRIRRYLDHVSIPLNTQISGATAEGLGRLLKDQGDPITVGGVLWFMVKHGPAGPLMTALEAWLGTAAFTSEVSRF